MGIGASVFLIVVGAILAFAVNVSVSGIELSTIGWILMVAGLVAAIAAVAMSRRTRTDHVHHRHS